MKKKKIAITLRVENIEKIYEKRDALSQDWIRFLEKMNIMPILMPNNLKNLDEIVRCWATRINKIKKVYAKYLKDLKI